MSSSPSFTSSLTGGAIAGVAVDLFFYPIDTIKTRIQSKAGFIASGGFKNIYRGIGSVAVGSGPGGALFFATYEKSKEFLLARKHARQPLKEGEQAPCWKDWQESMLASSLGELAACLVRVPTEVVKQRTQDGQHTRSLLAAQAIWSRHSSIGVVGVLREMYRGFGITVMREIPFSIIQYPLWEMMKEFSRQKSGQDEVVWWKAAIYGGTAGGIAAAATTPLDVLKTRKMLAKEKIGVLPLGRLILNEKGLRGFFAGVVPRTGWMFAGGCVFLGSYEAVTNIVHDARQKAPDLPFLT
ncbi:hypothetical protein HYFRA_00005747 [Hymenoscyphus fraxineus]|uniref:Uncharacterized protein n=1 Tax=Hymenoscyphus fraxineus TaxID=746836 RepID=A0A9N9KR56_9HELO|nr:hypothetical protein HYFRA_00005747 [Hymenoscyphus fraxineus]